MALDSVSLPSIWDVPVAVGVPALLGQSIGSGVSATLSSALVGTYEKWLVNSQAKTWGIFDSSNSQILTAAHVMGIDYSLAYAISDAPLEDGAFTSYNKVRAPFQASVSMVCDGTESGTSSILSSIESLVGVSDGTSSGISVRGSFIKTLETIVADTNIYSVVTPEFTFVNANIVGYRFRRQSSSGVTMIICEIALQEVRKTASLYYSTTQMPQGATAVQNGTVQTTTPTTAVSTAAASTRDGY